MAGSPSGVGGIAEAPLENMLGDKKCPVEMTVGRPRGLDGAGSASSTATGNCKPAPFSGFPKAKF
jgi:hypothetical protein